MANKTGKGWIKPGERRNPRGRAGKAKTIDVEFKADGQTKPAVTKKASNRTDGWLDILSGIGTAADSSTRARHLPDLVIPKNELESLYRGDGLAKKIVNLPVGEMLREWIEIKGDSDGSILKEMAAINTKAMLAKALRYSRLYGGAVMLAIVDDGRTLNEPLEIQNVRDVKGYRIYDRHQVSWTDLELVADPTSMQYGMPAYYRVSPYTTQTPFVVHHSRLWRFDGEELPESMRRRNQGWGDSVLQHTYDAVRSNGVIFKYVENIIRGFEQTTFSIQGLQEMIAAGEDDLVRKRIELMDYSRAILNAIFLDAEGENFAKHSSSVTGLPDLMDRFMLNVSAVTGIPSTKLFGRSPAGLNSTGESDIDQWYDQIRSDQEDEIRAPLEWMKSLHCAALGFDAEEYEVVFRSLSTPSEEIIARTRLIVSQTDKAYFDMGLNAKHILENRFGGDHYSMETELSGDWFDETEEPDPEPFDPDAADEELKIRAELDVDDE